MGRTTIQLLMTSLKTGLRGVMSNAIKDLSVSSLSPIDFEVKCHNSRSNILNLSVRSQVFPIATIVDS